MYVTKEMKHLYNKNFKTLEEEIEDARSRKGLPCSALADFVQYCEADCTPDRDGSSPLLSLSLVVPKCHPEWVLPLSTLEQDTSKGQKLDPWVKPLSENKSEPGLINGVLVQLGYWGQEESFLGRWVWPSAAAQAQITSWPCVASQVTQIRMTPKMACLSDSNMALGASPDLLGIHVAFGVTGAMDINKDSGLCRAMEPDMAPDSNLGLDITMALDGKHISPHKPNKHSFNFMRSGSN
ncbi:hypothetical protein STEG23_035573 [Scotinomys teguina]